MKLYILKDKIAYPCIDMADWAEWMANGGEEARRVALTSIEGVEVSTVFLGHDCSFGHGEPEIFETMVFVRESHNISDMATYDPNLKDIQIRYSSWADAIEGHERLVKSIRYNIRQAKDKAAEITDGFLFSP